LWSQLIYLSELNQLSLKYALFVSNSLTNCVQVFHYSMLSFIYQHRAAVTTSTPPDYRWLIAGVVLAAALVAGLVVLLVVMVRHRGRQDGRSRPASTAASTPSRLRNGVVGGRQVAVDERRRRQEKYFDTLCTDGYYNWTYDPDIGVSGWRDLMLFGQSYSDGGSGCRVRIEQTVPLRAETDSYIAFSFQSDIQSVFIIALKLFPFCPQLCPRFVWLILSSVKRLCS